jgi:hypothetical protein
VIQLIANTPFPTANIYIHHINICSVISFVIQQLGASAENRQRYPEEAVTRPAIAPPHVPTTHREAESSAKTKCYKDVLCAVDGNPSATAVTAPASFLPEPAWLNLY